MTVTVDVTPLVGNVCCGNCLSCRVLPFTDGAEFYCARRKGVSGNVATRTGKVSGALRKQRGCRAFESMDDEGGEG